MKDYVKKIFILTFCFFALSCSNLMSPSQEDTAPVDDGTIRFEINKNDNLSRNAAPQAFLNGIYYRLTLSKDGDSAVYVESKFQKTLSFTIPTPSWTGASIAKLEMYCPRTDGLVTDVSTDSDGVVTITSSPCMAGEKSFTLEANTRVFNFSIDLDFSGTDNGTIKLPVTVGSTNIKSCIIVPDFAGSNASKYIKAEVTAAGEIFVLSTAPFSDHSVFYFFEEDDDDIELSNDQLKNAKLIYSDSITVFSNTTTDKWIGINGKEKTVDLDSLQYSTFYVDGTSGNDIYFGSKLKPVKTLSAAISKCANTSDGGTIYIQSQPADTDKIVIDKKVKIEKLSTVTTAITLPNIEIKDFSSATQVSLKGVKISKSGATGISVGKNCSLTLDNVEVSGCKDGITADEACTVDLTNSSAVKSCTGYGIQLKNSSGVLKIDGTEVNADQALTSDFDDASLFYKKAKIIRYLSVPSDSSTHDDVLNGLISSIVSFGDGAQLVFGKTTACSLTWNLKKGIVIDNSGSGTYTIKSAKDGGTIKLARSSSASDKFPLVKSTSWCTWNINNVTFEGGVNTVDDEDIADDGQGGAFYLKALSSVTVNFTSCNFYKNSAVYGGAIYAEGGTVNLTDCTIGGSSTNQNIASEEGGAVYLADASSSLTFNSGTVSNNSAKNGGAIYINSYATAELKGGLISSNTATVSGGAIYHNGNLKVSGYTYITPGTAALKNDVYLASSNKYIEVTGALSPKSDGAATGSAVLYTAAITPSTWKRGTQVLSGGYAATDAGKFKGSEADWLTIKDTNDSNRVKLYTSYKIYVAGSDHNTALGDGKSGDDGGLGTKAKPYASIEEAVNQCWDSNYADGFTIYLSGELKDAAQEIPAKNTTAKTGLAKSITLTGYTGNNKDIINRNLTAAPESGSGTALTINNTAPVTIKKIKITGGYTNGNGGGILVSGVDKASLTLTTGALITGNTAGGTDSNGGGIYFAGTGTTDSKIGKLIMNEDAKIQGNTASGNGGGVYIQYVRFYMSGSSLVGDIDSTYTVGATDSSKSNKAANGGGVYVGTGSYSHIGYVPTDTGKSISAMTSGYGVCHNYATKNGGGVYAAGSGFFMGSGKISKNGAGEKGGGIYASGWVYLHTDAQIGDGLSSRAGASTNSNTAADGGGIYISSSNIVYLGYNGTENAPFNSGKGVLGNYASGDGGGIYCTSGTLDIRSGEISHNAVPYATSPYHCGGGIYQAGGTINLKGGTLAKNFSYLGGAIYVNGGTFSMSGGVIGDDTKTDTAGGLEGESSNYADQGGALCVMDATSVSITGGTMVYNGAGSGGAICTNVNFTLKDVTIKYNYALNFGGGVYVCGSKTLSLDGGTSEGAGTTFIKNACSESMPFGGAIYLNETSGLNIKGNVSIPDGSLGVNDIYLRRDGSDMAAVNVNGTLTGDVITAMITPKEASVGDVVLKRSGSSPNLTALAKRFMVTPGTSQNWGIDSYGKLKTIIGTKTAPNEVGDIVYNDGSASPINVATLNGTQKSTAVAVIFYATTAGSIKGVGLKEPSTLQYAKNGSVGSNTILNTSDDNGEDNLTIIKGLSDYNSENYSLFSWADTYGVEVSGDSTGWYIPAINEFKDVYVTDSSNNLIVNKQIQKIGTSSDVVLLTTTDSEAWYWTSSEYDAENARQINCSSHDPGNSRKYSSNRKSRVIRKF